MNKQAMKEELKKAYFELQKKSEELEAQMEQATTMKITYTAVTKGHKRENCTENFNKFRASVLKKLAYYKNFKFEERCAFIANQLEIYAHLCGYVLIQSVTEDGTKRTIFKNEKMLLKMADIIIA